MKTIKIGRNPDNDIVIDAYATTVSGFHAELKVSDNGIITLCDCSTNGTFINGVKASKGVEVAIKKGDEVRLGPTERLDWKLVKLPTTQSASTRINTDGTRLENDDKNCYTIGSAADNRIVLSDSSNLVSRYHAIFKKYTDGKCYIYDQSTNGTYVNGVKIKSKMDYQVTSSDNISFANVKQFNWSSVGRSKPSEPNYHANPVPPPPAPKTDMFSDPFSFDGRIRRTEMVISTLIYAVLALIVNAIGANGGAAGIIFFAYIPLAWFNLAQGTKRCHDRGNSGWYQLIPLYGLWMLFGDSDTGRNEYGDNPKGVN